MFVFLALGEGVRPPYRWLPGCRIGVEVAPDPDEIVREGLLFGNSW